MPRSNNQAPTRAGKRRRAAHAEIGWDDLSEIRVRVSAGADPGGSFEFHLRGPQSELSVPLGHTSHDFVERLQALPGFDNGVLVDALSTRRDAEFVCWRAGGGGLGRVSDRFRR